MEDKMARGTEILELADLKDIELPPATPTYTPLSHFDLTSSLITISQDILTGYELSDQLFEVARNRQQLFGVLTFNANHGDMGLTIGCRNSLDRSMSVGLCVGSQVFVCSNMMFTAEGGGLVIMKKHSKNLLNVLEDTAIPQQVNGVQRY